MRHNIIGSKESVKSNQSNQSKSIHLRKQCTAYKAPAEGATHI